jgi:hypothetical protein
MTDRPRCVKEVPRFPDAAPHCRDYEHEPGSESRVTGRGLVKTLRRQPKLDVLPASYRAIQARSRAISVANASSALAGVHREARACHAGQG